jgi:hypothetical protein
LPSLPAVVRKLGPPDEPTWRDIAEEPTTKGIVIDSLLHESIIARSWFDSNILHQNFHGDWQRWLMHSPLIDLEAARWHLRTPVARDLVWEEFQLPYV